MRVLYWLSFIPTAPFFALSWVAYGLAYLLNFIGEAIHDQTTYRAWRVLHFRACKQVWPDIKL